MQRGPVVGSAGRRREHVVSSLDGRVRRAELGTVRVAAAVGRIAVVSAQRRSVRCMARRERRLTGRTVRVHRMDGRVRTGVGRQQSRLGADQQRRVYRR